MSSVPPDSHQRILNALAMVVAEEGYANAKVARVAKEAHVSLRTFYETFESKESAFLALHKQLIEFAASHLESIVTFDRPWPEVMRGAFDSYLRLLSAQPKLTAAMMLELTTLSDEGHAARNYARERMCATMILLVERGREANPDVPSRALSPAMAQCLIGAIVELVTSGVVDEHGRSLDEFVDTTTDLLISVVGNTDGLAFRPAVA
jgi:TetR/AcrR family fatty acid metabolism transcriptional regulator